MQPVLLMINLQKCDGTEKTWNKNIAFLAHILPFCIFCFGNILIPNNIMYVVPTGFIFSTDQSTMSPLIKTQHKLGEVVWLDDIFTVLQWFESRRNERWPDMTQYRMLVDISVLPNKVKVKRVRGIKGDLTWPNTGCWQTLVYCQIKSK
jgi:hypothetical protein